MIQAIPSTSEFCGNNLGIEAMSSNIFVRERQIISRGHGDLERFIVERTRFDGRVETLPREVYDPGDGVAILLYDLKSTRVVLVRQFRMPAYLKEGHETLIEVCAGRLEGIDAESRIIKEAQEETGFVVQIPRRIFEAYASPGCFGEKINFFIAEYTPGSQISKGGGDDDEGEDIEILEPTLDEALKIVSNGEIVDVKTILLLHYAKLTGLMCSDDVSVRGSSAGP